MTTTSEVVSLWEKLNDVKAAASSLGVSPDTVRHHLRKAGISCAKPPLLSKESLQQYVNEGKSFSEIAKIIGNTVAYVSARAKKLGVVSEHMHMAAVKDLPEPIDKVYKRYLDGQSLDSLRKLYSRPIAIIKQKLVKAFPNIVFRTTDEISRPAILNNAASLAKMAETYSFRRIARIIGVRATTVCNAAARHHIKSSFGAPDYQKISEEVLRELMEKQGLSVRDVSLVYGIPAAVVRRQVKKHNIPLKKVGGQERESRIPQLNDRDWLIEEYVVKKRSMGSLAIELNVSVGLIAYALQKQKIKRRTQAEYLELLLSNPEWRQIQKDGDTFDSQLEVVFSNKTDNITGRNIQFESNGSRCFIDFKVGDNFVEVKPKERAIIPGPDRIRLIKQFLVCKNNSVDLTIWTGNEYYKIDLEDADIYYCQNWKLIFKSPDECCDWLLKYGFKPPKHSLQTMFRAITRLQCKSGDELNANAPNHYISKITEHFFQHYWNSTHRGYLPISAAWEFGNQTVLRQAVHDLWDRKIEINIYGLAKVISRLAKDFANVSLFKPWIASYIYDRYLPNGGKVIDTSCGWGGRFLGTFGKEIEYVGYDLNALSINSHQNLREFAGNRIKIEPKFIEADSCTAKFEVGDLLFTSPPYDDTERYSGVDSARTLTEPIIRNIFKQAPCPLIVLNVPKKQDSITCDIASVSNYELKERLEMKTKTFMGRQYTHEPILVFKRK